MRPSTWSDGALRRLATAVALAQVVLTALLTPVFALGADQGAGRWAGGGFLGQLVFIVVVLAFPVAGLLVARQLPRNAVAWCLLLVGALWSAELVAAAYATVGLVLVPGSLPGTTVAAAFNEGSWAPWIVVTNTFLLLLFPDGRLPSRRWRPLAVLAATVAVVPAVLLPLTVTRFEEGPARGITNPLGLEPVPGVVTVAVAVTLPLIPVVILASAAALALRFRRAVGLERDQLRWLASAGAAIAATYLVALSVTYLDTLLDATWGWVDWVQTLSLLSFALLPLAIGIAMLRHRLYDIDVVVNRALVYGSLTATLVGTYLVSVLVLRAALTPLTGESDLAVAGSTLAVAALFGPLRRRIQALVDRRFFRRRYDAGRTLEGFSTRLRHEVDLGAVGSDLRAAVTDTVQPAHVSLWLRP